MGSELNRQAYCAACRLVLDWYIPDVDNEPDVGHWVHAGGAIAKDPTILGHEPEPVEVPADDPLLDARTVCDFCDAPSPDWVYPCRSFAVTPNSGSADDWAACDACASLIDDRQYAALVRRAAKGRGPIVAYALGLLYQAFEENRTGPRVHRMEGRRHA
jgi:hypothetical protein